MKPACKEPKRGLKKAERKESPALKAYEKKPKK